MSFGRSRAYLSLRGQKTLLLVTMFACGFLAGALISKTLTAWTIAFLAELMLTLFMVRIRREIRIIRTGQIFAGEIVSIQRSSATRLGAFIAARCREAFVGFDVVIKVEHDGQVRRFVSRPRAPLLKKSELQVGDAVGVCVSDFFSANARTVLLEDTYWSYWADTSVPFEHKDDTRRSA